MRTIASPSLSFPRKREPITTDFAETFPTVVMGPRLRGEDAIKCKSQFVPVAFVAFSKSSITFLPTREAMSP